MGDAQPHISVMLDEVLAALAPVAGEVYVDGTFGAGGYSRALMDKADCTVVAIDRDRTALARAEKIKEEYGARLVPLHGCFGDAAELLAQTPYDHVDGFVLDLGVSSMQLDEGQRGFSFRFDAPLDMRMDQSSGGITAADIVNGWEEKELADTIYQYGDERYSRRVAKAIIWARAEEAITTTGRLADIVRGAIPKSRKDDIDPATRTFQALRIAVNEELQELERALAASEEILKPGGRLVVVSFHSLEDGIVKKFMRERAGMVSHGSRHRPMLDTEEKQPTFSLSFKKAILPTEEEMKRNPRARSARMRVAVRTDAPVWNSGDGQKIRGSA